MGPAPPAERGTIQNLAFAVAGPGVSNDEYGLTAVQRRRFDAFNSVGATVIRDGAGRRAGVLTAIGRQDDGKFAAEGEGIEVLRGLAMNLSYEMADAYEWMLPDESEEHAFRALTPEAGTSLDKTEASTPTDAAPGQYKSFRKHPRRKPKDFRRGTSMPSDRMRWLRLYASTASVLRTAQGSSSKNG